MDRKEKSARLRQLDERVLREEVLIPLLTRMGFEAATVYHGPQERGKDIICYDTDVLGAREYCAVVAKTADLNGSVSSQDGLREVVYQVEQCFNVPYEDLFGMARVTMDRVWVVTTGSVASGAAGSVFDHLSKTNLSKLVRVICCEQLIVLIDRHYPSYWDSATESIDSIREERARLVGFCRKLLLTLGGEADAVDAVIAQVRNSSSLPEVHPSPQWFLRRLSPYSVEFDAMPSEHSHKLWSTQCGCIGEAFIASKQKLYHAMFDVDEVIGRFEKVISITDPRKFVEAFEDELADEHPFWQAAFGPAAEANREVANLRGGLADIDELEAGLSRLGKLEWANELADSVRELRCDIEGFLSHVDKDAFTLLWRIETFDGRGRLRMLYRSEPPETGDILSTTHTRQVRVYGKRAAEYRRITTEDVVDEVQFRLREYLDRLLGNP